MSGKYLSRSGSWSTWYHASASSALVVLRGGHSDLRSRCIPARLFEPSILRAAPEGAPRKGRTDADAGDEGGGDESFLQWGHGNDFGDGAAISLLSAATFWCPGFAFMLNRTSLRPIGHALCRVRIMAWASCSREPVFSWSRKPSTPVNSRSMSCADFN